ncbi:hypothetical protein EAI_06455 [Harpegnathos saltator]|uniref:Uncharacterized protein n=1 Tax=Harpegnathos saltator TaxID=610380 RepID=E2BL82_HARSA|nr:hypothetical protein EAI_06455 [Harpegnathos saltator]
MEVGEARTHTPTDDAPAVPLPQREKRKRGVTANVSPPAGSRKRGRWEMFPSRQKQRRIRGGNIKVGIPCVSVEAPVKEAIIAEAPPGETEAALSPLDISPEGAVVSRPEEA